MSALLDVFGRLTPTEAFWCGWACCLGAVLVVAGVVRWIAR